MINFVGRPGGMRRNSGCGGCLVPLVGLVFLVIGIFLIKDTLQFLPGTVTAQGTIIHCSYDDAQSTACAPTVRFMAKSGQSIAINPSFSSSSFYEGQSVQIRYHPNTPQDGRIDSFTSVWLVPLACGGVGLLVLILIPFRLLRGLLRRLFGL